MLLCGTQLCKMASTPTCSIEKTAWNSEKVLGTRFQGVRCFFSMSPGGSAHFTKVCTAFAARKSCCCIFETMKATCRRYVARNRFAKIMVFCIFETVKATCRIFDPRNRFAAQKRC